jgi:hypothetical protein
LRRSASEVLVDAHGDELDHAVGHAHAALELLDHLRLGLDDQEHVVAFAVLRRRRRALLPHFSTFWVLPSFSA